MRAAKYFTSVLPDGRISIPDDIRKELAIHKGEKLEVVLSYITIRSREEEIKCLQKKIQEDVIKKAKKKLRLKEIDRLVHEIRKA